MWSLEKSMRIILSANLVSDFYVDEMKKGVMEVSLANSISAIITAASASSSSSS